MAQLRQDHHEFTRRGAQVVIVGPESRAAFRRFWQQERLPFIGLPDPDHRVAKLYGQQVRLLKLGRMPALVLIDRHGRVHYRHFGSAMHDIPPNEDLLALLDDLNHHGALPGTDSELESG